MTRFSSITQLAVVGSVALVGLGADAYSTSLACSTSSTWNGEESFGPAMGITQYTTSSGNECKFATADDVDVIQCGGTKAVTLSTDTARGLKMAVSGGATISDTSAEKTTTMHESDAPNTCIGTGDGVKKNGIIFEIDFSAVVTNGAVEIVAICGGKDTGALYVVKKTFTVEGCTPAPTGPPSPPTNAPTNAPSDGPTKAPSNGPTKAPTLTPSTATPTLNPNTTKAPTSAAAGVSVAFGAVIACVSAVAASLF